VKCGDAFDSLITITTPPISYNPAYIISANLDSVIRYKLYGIIKQELQGDGDADNAFPITFLPSCRPAEA
jgi:hypothetical protein